MKRMWTRRDEEEGEDGRWMSISLLLLSYYCDVEMRDGEDDVVIVRCRLGFIIISEGSSCSPPGKSPEEAHVDNMGLAAAAPLKGQ